MSQLFPANPFLLGHLAPISFEADAADLPIWGEVPKDVHLRTFLTVAAVYDRRQSSTVQHRRRS